MKAIDDFFDRQEEPLRSFYIALKEIILLHDKSIECSIKYGMPFFSYKGKMFCYFWMHKKFKKPYIGWVEGGRFDHPELLAENRSRMKIYLMDPLKDIPLKTIKIFLRQAIELYTSGVVPIRKNK